MKSANTLCATFCASLLAASFAWAEAPSVDWASSPVKPGDHVLLQGCGWDTNSVVEIDGQRVTPDQVSETGLVFAYPSAQEKIVTGKVIAKDGSASETFTLNAPTVWWMQGDGGDISTPGGWLRVFGKNLAGGEVRVEKWEGGKVEKSATTIPPFHYSTLPLTRVDEYELAAKIPSDIESGEYAVEVKSAISGWVKVGTWKIAAPRKLWKDDVFDITSFRSVEKGVISDSQCFTNALAAAGKNGGGIVLFPRGRYSLKGVFEIPPNTLVRGESRATTLLDWGDMKEPELYLLICNDCFGLEELTVHTGYSRGFITTRRGLEKEAFGRENMIWPKTHDVVLKNLTFRFVTDEHRDNMSDDNFFARYRWYKRYPYGKNGEALHFPAVERFRMDNVDVYQDKDPMHAVFLRLYGHYIHVSNCKFHGGGYIGFGGREFIFEDTECRCNTYSMCGGTYNAYFARNRGWDDFKNDGEGLTHDGQCGVFVAKAKVEGTAVTFLHEKPKTGKSPLFDVVTKLNGYYALEIISGRGKGQIRKVVKMDDWNHVTLDRPFGVAPDEKSRFNFAFVRHQVLMLDNFFEDATIGLQLWGGSYDYILARNRFVRGGGIRSIGLGEGLGCFRVQVFDNVIEENLGRNPLCFSMEGFGWGNVLRRNEIRSNGSFSSGVPDTVIEHNVIRNTDYGISARGAYIGENTFDNVEFPLRKALGSKLSPSARAVHEASQAAFVGRLKQHADRPYTLAEFKRVFAGDFTISDGSRDVREALAGKRGKRPFGLRTTLSLGPGLPPVERCLASAVSVGGWTFGEKPTELPVDPWSKSGQRVGRLQVTPTGAATEPFTVPLTVEIVGRDGWRARVSKDDCLVNKDDDYGVLLRGSWRYAVVDGWKISQIPEKPDWKIAEKRDPKDGGVDTTDLDVSEAFRLAQKCKDGCSMIYETEFELKRAMRVTFNRCDISSALFVDGKQIMPENTWWRSCETVPLAAGRHTVRIFRGCQCTMRWCRSKSLRVYLQFPDGVKPGEWSCVDK